MKRFKLLLAMVIVLATSVVAWGKNGRLNIVTNSTAMYSPMYSLFSDKFITDEMKQNMAIIVFYTSKSNREEWAGCKILLEEVKKFQKKLNWKNVEFIDVSRPIDRRYQCLMDRFKVKNLPDVWVILKNRASNTVYEQRIVNGAVTADVITDAAVKLYMSTRYAK
jgi:hypothetical protein